MYILYIIVLKIKLITNLHALSLNQSARGRRDLLEFEIVLDKTKQNDISTAGFLVHVLYL